MDFFSAIVLGIVEGLTEFLPVSSTGHMIMVAKILGLSQDDPAVKCFEVVIQLGSILAVLFIYFSRLKQNFTLWIKLIVAFLPAAIIGLLLHSKIKSLFDASITAYMLIIYGVIFIIVELFLRKKRDFMRISDVDCVSYKTAFIIGCAQCLAMVPGTSRSGVTIIAGLLSGLNRASAAMFSFLLAIPTMFAATIYDSYKNRAIFAQNADNIWIFLVGGAVAFVTAFIVVKLFLKFVEKFDYIPFGIYRIIAGILFLKLVL